VRRQAKVDFEQEGRHHCQRDQCQILDSNQQYHESVCNWENAGRTSEVKSVMGIRL
jgi:hypothetical protein